MRAQALRDAMMAEDYDAWGEAVPGFVPFWRFLLELADSESHCSCRSGQCGPPACAIRACAKAKGVLVCALCGEYPCGHIRELAQRYPMLLADGARMKRVGVDAWTQEQEARRRSGFSYADIRCRQDEGATAPRSADGKEP
jgi:hypothetical protein